MFRIAGGHSAAREADHLFENAPVRHGIQIVEIERNQSQSLHWVRVWEREPKHLHAVHDSTIQLQEGRGSLYLKDTRHRLEPGDTIMIPRNIPHYYVNEAQGACSQVMVIFSPPFDGRDIVPVP